MTFQANKSEKDLHFAEKVFCLLTCVYNFNSISRSILKKTMFLITKIDKWMYIYTGKAPNRCVNGRRGANPMVPTNLGFF